MLYINSSVFEANVIVLTETWLKPSVHDSEISSNNFFVYWKDRQTRRGGGVLIGVKSNLTSEFVDISESSGIEFISVKLSFPKRNIFLTCSYMHV